jgi:hypothetical protein
VTDTPSITLAKSRAFGVGDRVLTPLGKVACVVRVRPDGYLDALYEGKAMQGSPAVVLQPQHVRRLY